MATAAGLDDHLSMPVLLRRARTAYSAAILAALAAAGHDDIPKNGLYVLGGLSVAKGGRPLSQLIDELGISKQAAGQLVDALVTRGYLRREVAPEDRRRLTIALTDHGKAAAKVLGVARATVDAALVARSKPKDVKRARRVLALLIEIGNEQTTPDEKG